MSLNESARAIKGLNIPLHHIFIILMVFTIFTGLVLYATSGGIRGTDPYWYVADVESLSEGRGVSTNVVYPAAIYKKNPSLPLPFVHNVLSVYMAAPAAMIFGGFFGWIVTNLFSAFIASLLIYYVVLRKVNAETALVVTVAFLLMPLTFWQVTQPLIEASILIFSAAFIAVFSFSGSSFKRHLIALLIAGLIFYCRKSFMPLLFFMPLLYFYNSENRNFRDIVRTLILFSVSLVIIFSAKFLFKAGVSWKVLDILMTSVPGETGSSVFFFSLEPLVFSFTKWAGKVFHMLSIQFYPKESLNYFAVFFLPFNLLLFSFGLLFRPSMFKSQWAQAAIMFILIHFMTIAVFQNMFRYMAPILPVLIASAAIALSGTGLKAYTHKAKVFVVVLILLLVPVNYTLANYSKAQGITHAHMRQKFADTVLPIIPTTDTVMLSPRGFSYAALYAAYVLRPRLTLYTSETLYNKDKEKIHLQLIKEIDVKWLICSSKSELPVLLEEYIELVVDVKYDLYGLRVYKVLAK